jgi:hypothetical protein
MATVTIGSLVLPAAPTAGKGFWFETLTDWYATPDSKVAAQSRPQAHGSFRITMDYRDAATPSVEGHFGGTTHADVLAAIDTLASLANGSPQTMTVTDDLRTTSREVSIRNISIPDTHGRPVLDFAIDMLAPDPRRYGADIVTSATLPVSGSGLTYPITYPLTYGTAGTTGRRTITNAGTAATWPRLEVTGGLDVGFSLVELVTGREIRYERAVPAGSTVFLDPRTGRAWVDAPANDVSGYLTRSDWWSVPAGGSTTVQFSTWGASSGTPTFTARTAPAYW